VLTLADTRQLSVAYTHSVVVVVVVVVAAAVSVVVLTSILEVAYVDECKTTVQMHIAKVN